MMNVAEFDRLGPRDFENGATLDEIREALGELELAQVALELVWGLYVQSNLHLGLERASGVEHGCIACICAAGLRRGMDPVPVERLRKKLEEVKAR